MKKLYFLLCTLLITSISFGQVISSDGFAYPDGSLVPNGGWATFSGNAGDLLVSSSQAQVQHGAPSEDAKLEFTSITGTIFYGLDFSVDDLGAPYTGGDNEYFALFSDGGTSNFRGRLDIVPPSGAGDFSVGISSATSTANAVWAADLTYGTTYRAIVKYDQDTNIAELWIDASAPTDPSILGEDGTDPGTVISAFALRQSDSSENETIRVDNLMIGGTFNDVLVFVASIDPTLTLSDGPVNGDTFIADPETATPGIANIDFTTTNFTMSNETSPGSGVSDGSGDGFITWSVVNTTGSVFVDGGNIFTSNNTSITYPVTGLVNGQTYFFTSELVANNGATLVPAVIYSFTFTIASYTVVPNLAALRASTIGDDLYYQVSGEVIGTFMQNNRNQKYIQDATAGILIDDPNFNIATVYNIGDGVENIKGQLSSFNGVLQFVPVADAAEVPASSTGNVITPEVVTITELLSNWENYESELVEIKGATFVGATGNFATGTDYPINDGASDLNFRTNFFDANYIGSLIPTIPQDLVVLVAEFNGTPQVTARDLADVTLRIERDAINGFNLYPNPVTNGKLFINTLSNADKEIQIYNILGKQVLSTKLKGSELNVNKLTSGIYILKINEDGKTATRKLVIK